VEVFAYLARSIARAGAMTPIDYRDGVLMTMTRSRGQWLLDDLTSKAWLAR